MHGELITKGALHISWQGDSCGAEITLRGEINEKCELAFLAERVQERVTVDLGEVVFINSLGIRVWIQLLQALNKRGVAVTIRRCPELMILHMNVIVEAQSGAHVESFFAPYECLSCCHDADVCINVSEHISDLQQNRPPMVACPECGAPMDFCELPDRYLQFITH